MLSPVGSAGLTHDIFRYGRRRNVLLEERIKRKKRPTIQFMDDVVHKFYCGLCRIDIMGASIARLCVNVIEHNNKFHIHAYNQWSIEEMHASPCYSAPSVPQPQYVTPYALTTNWEWGSAAQPPDITPEDIEFLAGLKVLWNTRNESLAS